MSNEKLLAKLGALLERARSADRKQLKKLREVLHQLKKKQKELKESLESVEDEGQRRKIRQDIEVLKLQRKKGVAVYKEIKKTRVKHGNDESEDASQ